MASLRTPRHLLSTRFATINRTRSSARFLCTTPRSLASWSTGPAPPRLPKEEQELFERLQKQSTGAFSTPSDPEPTAAAASAAPQADVDVIDELSARGPTSARRTPPQINQSPHAAPVEVNANGEGEELHPNIRRGAVPEFEGDVNPRTGEVGGPKNDPLRWGGEADWSYNGRVTDF